eukprot:g6756.t1
MMGSKVWKVTKLVSLFAGVGFLFCTIWNINLLRYWYFTNPGEGLYVAQYESVLVGPEKGRQSLILVLSMQLQRLTALSSPSSEGKRGEGDEDFSWNMSTLPISLTSLACRMSNLGGQTPSTFCVSPDESVVEIAAANAGSELSEQQVLSMAALVVIEHQRSLNQAFPLCRGKIDWYCEDRGHGTIPRAANREGEAVIPCWLTEPNEARPVLQQVDHLQMNNIYKHFQQVAYWESIDNCPSSSSGLGIVLSPSTMKALEVWARQDPSMCFSTFADAMSTATKGMGRGRENDTGNGKNELPRPTLTVLGLATDPSHSVAMLQKASAEAYGYRLHLISPQWFIERQREDCMCKASDCFNGTFQIGFKIIFLHRAVNVLLEAGDIFPSDYILLVDSYDAFFTRPASELLVAFDSFDSDFVAGGILDLCPGFPCSHGGVLTSSRCVNVRHVRMMTKITSVFFTSISGMGTCAGRICHQHRKHEAARQIRRGRQQQKMNVVHEWRSTINTNSWPPMPPLVLGSWNFPAVVHIPGEPLCNLHYCGVVMLASCACSAQGSVLIFGLVSALAFLTGISSAHLFAESGWFCEATRRMEDRHSISELLYPLSFPEWYIAYT